MLMSSLAKTTIHCVIISMIMFMASWIILLKHQEVILFDLIIQQQETIRGYEIMVNTLLEDLNKARLGGSWPHFNVKEHSHDT